MARRFKVRFRKNFDVISVVKALFLTLIGLWVGGVLLDALGDVMNGTTSAFYQGLTLIGWTVTSGTITDTTTSSGILVVVGIIAISAVVLRFVKFSWR